MLQHLSANGAAAFKVRKYAEVSNAQQASFIPFAAESTGGLTPGAIELLKQIALASNDHLRLDPAQARPGAMQAAVAIFVCLLLCIRLVGGFNGNTDKTRCWSAVCAASVSGR